MEENLVSDELNLSESAKNHLQVAGKWVYIMSIIGLTILMYGVVSLIYDYMNLYKWDDVPTGGGVGYLMSMMLFPVFLVMGIICFFPLYYLYKFSSNLKIAFGYDDSEALEISFRYLKFHYISIGILILIYIAYLLVVKIIF
jgi:hypothetical protein